MITVMGLFAMVANMMIYRTREIGIRRVLGATMSNILVLLSRNFVRLVLIASIIATPVAVFVTNEWLETFAFRITLQAWMLVVPVLIIGVVVVMVIVFRSIRVVSLNPMDSLKYE